MSNHFRAADLRLPSDDARLDLTDLYVFAAPLDGRQTVLIIDVSPFWSGVSRVPRFHVTSGFHPDAVYRINVDNDGDVQADVAFNFVFSELSDGGQNGTAYYATGSLAKRLEPSGEVIVQSTPVGFDASAVAASTDDCQLFMGVRSDPFFADVDGAERDLHWTGRDTFAQKNVLSIALQVPNDMLLAAGSDFGVWATVSLRRHGRLVQVDREGHPAINLFMDSFDVGDDHNEGHPADDVEKYFEMWTALLQDHGYSPDESRAAALASLPNILAFDTTRPATYPNGRLLTDDVFSARLAFLTHGTAMSQRIGPHNDLLAEFPFLGPPNAFAL
jgi:Domain of unknown function (DUF4331)